TESPWGERVVHGSIPAGVMAIDAMKRIDAPGLRIARFTVDLFRPVPKEPLRPRSEVVRRGRRIGVVETVLEAQGQAVARAHTLMLPGAEEPASPAAVLPGPEGLEPADLPAVRSGNGFLTNLDARIVPGERRTAIWFRLRGPYLAGETL